MGYGGLKILLTLDFPHSLQVQSIFEISISKIFISQTTVLHNTAVQLN